MTQIKKVKTSEGVQFYPQTHTKAVIDDNGYSVESRMQAVQDMVNQAQMGIGAVPSDLTPTEGSTNWVTSGGVYAAFANLGGELYTNIDLLPRLVEANGNIASTGKWNVQSTYIGGYADVSDLHGETMKITANNNYGSIYAFTKDKVTTNDTTMSSHYATGSTRTEIAIGATESVVVPDNAGYLYVYMFSNDTVRTPSSISVRLTSSRIDFLEEECASYSTLKETVENVTDILYTKDIVIASEWEQGAIFSSTGDNTSSTTRLRMKEIHHNDFDLTLTITSGKIYYIAYDSNGNFISANGWITTSPYTIAAGSYYRLVYAVDDSTTMSTSMLSNLSIISTGLVGKFTGLEEEITLIDTSTNIIDGKTAENGWPGTNGWVSNSNNWKGYFITVRAGEMYRITANASNTTKIAMLRNSSHTNGAAVNSLATYYITAGQYQDVTVPSGATCMWVDALAGSGITTTPQSIYAYYGEILDVVISHSNRIGELEDEVGESDIITVPITSYNSGYYIQADSTNTDFGNAITESNTDYAVSPFINVKGYNGFSVSTITSGRQYAGTVVYNAAKEPIAGYYYNSGTSGSYIATGELPSNAEYIRISHWTNNFSTGLVNLHLYDTLKDFTVRKVSEVEDRISALESSGSIPSGLTTYDYIGEKISFAIHQFTGNRYMTLSPSAYTVQGGAVFGDYYMVGFSNHAYLDVYNLSTKTKLAGITLEAPSISNAHANTIFFSNQYHTDGDEFPILYMCSGYNSEGYSKVYGYRVINNNGSWSATIVHTITINSEGKWTEMVVDNVRQKAWIKKEISGTKEWYCVDMPQYANGDATIDLSILEPNFIAPSYESSGQCHLFFNDRIFFISGIPADNVSKLYVLNTLTGKYESIVDLIPVFGTDEPENIIIYNGYLHVGYRQSLGRLYF